MTTSNGKIGTDALSKMMAELASAKEKYPNSSKWLEAIGFNAEEIADYTRSMAHHLTIEIIGRVLNVAQALEEAGWDEDSDKTKDVVEQLSLSLVADQQALVMTAFVLGFGVKTHEVGGVMVPAVEDTDGE